MRCTTLVFFSPFFSGDEPEEEEGARGDGEDNHNYPDLLQKLSQKWLFVQLTHQVSAAATNSFWNLAFDLMPDLIKCNENSEKKHPGFIHLRRQLYLKRCPKIHMKFVYLNRSTQEIEVVNTDTNPRLSHSKANYIKLYEEAHVNVSNTYFIYLLFRI